MHYYHYYIAGRSLHERVFDGLERTAMDLSAGFLVAAEFRYELLHLLDVGWTQVDQQHFIRSHSWR